MGCFRRIGDQYLQSRPYRCANQCLVHAQRWDKYRVRDQFCDSHPAFHQSSLPDGAGGLRLELHGPGYFHKYTRRHARPRLMKLALPEPRVLGRRSGFTLVEAIIVMATLVLVIGSVILCNLWGVAMAVRQQIWLSASDDAGHALGTL